MLNSPTVNKQWTLGFYPSQHIFTMPLRRQNALISHATSFSVSQLRLVGFILNSIRIYVAYNPDLNTQS